MLIEGAGVVAHRPTPVPFFIPFVMKKIMPIVLVALLLASCNTPEPEPKGTTITFTETDETFANPERGLYIQAYYTSADLDYKANVNVIKYNRNSGDITLYLHSYYLTDYMESDIPQEFFDRLEANMNALREGGAKAVLRFSYKYSMDTKDAPWNAKPEWIHQHIDQIAPYLQKHADVILCVQCGLLGSWGEWYYVSYYKMNPSKDADFEPRWEVLEHMLRAVPESRQVGLRTPMFKRRYLKMRGDSLSSPLTQGEAYSGSYKSRICGHNDCFVSSSNDVGTYSGNADREFWAEDTKYTFMGGETCEKATQSNGANALAEMEKYHWTYLNKDYREEVTNMWRRDGTMDVIKRRLGYRFALEKVIHTSSPRIGNKFEAYCELHNSGFAAPNNARDVELVFVNTNTGKKYVFPQTEDPRFWMPGETQKFTLACTLNDMEPGSYKLYLNLPDPYPAVHDNPLFSIRLANENVWEEETGYNYITSLTVGDLPD